jgi:hypothetical protein
MAEAEEHAANEWLCRHVSRAQVLQAELLRLSDRVPAAFLCPEARQAAVLFDFAYLKSSEECDARVDASPELADAWDELRDSCAPLVARFYQVGGRPVRSNTRVRGRLHCA